MSNRRIINCCSTHLPDSVNLPTAERNPFRVVIPRREDVEGSHLSCKRTEGVFRNRKTEQAPARDDRGGGTRDDMEAKQRYI